MLINIIFNTLIIMKLSKMLAAVSVASSSLYLGSAALAQDANSFLGGITGTGQGGNLLGFVTTVINWAIGFAALVCVVILIAAGYMYITAAGDEGKIQKATSTLTWAIVGLVVCFIAVLLVRFVLQTILKV